MYYDSGFGNRLITPNHLRSFPQAVLYLDTESRTVPYKEGELHLLRLAWSCRVNYDKELKPAAERWMAWKDARELCAYITLEAKPKRPLYLYGHNIFFDLMVAQALKWLPQWGWKLQFVHDEGLAFILIIERDGARIKVVSTTNYFDCSLEALGHSMGLEKLKVDFREVQDDQLSIYCRRDVSITRRAMEEYFAFNRSHDTGRFSLTKAGQCFACYRHRFLDFPIYTHDSDEVIQLERGAYFGGRVECFRLGRLSGGPFDFYDVNSMYPSVMAPNLYPCRLARYYPEASIAELTPFRDRAAIIAEIGVQTSFPWYALRREGKLLFPVGSFTTSVCTQGFWKAVDSGHVRFIKRAAVYEWAPIFRSYVNYWWPLKDSYRQQGNEVYTRIVKLFLNSLYGKFGQKGYEVKTIERPLAEGPYRIENYDLSTGKRSIEYSLFGVTFEKREVGNARNTFVAVAAHVTEYARFALLDCLSRFDPSRLCYCDTDSVVVSSGNGGGADPILRSTGLGALTHDHRVASLVLSGPKDYQSERECKIKGVPKGAAKLDEGIYEYTQFCGLPTHLTERISDGFYTKNVEKRLKREYTKGIVGKDGRVSPLVLDEL